MRLKERVKQLETFVKNLDTKIDFVRNHTADSTEFSKLETKVEKNENAIKAIIELCQPIIIERLSGLVGEIATGLESELKNIAVKRTKKSKTESKPTTKTTKKGVKKNV